jgi:signal transduction histidine kinase
VPWRSTPVRSATSGLLLGLAITLAAVVTYSWYITRQIAGLRELQNDLIDRNRRASLQLLRIQNDLNAIGLAMRDMLDGDQPYPLTAWSSQFERLRTDLEDALRREQEVTLAGGMSDQRRFLGSSFDQFWRALDHTLALAGKGQEAEARSEIRISLQARQAALSTAVARLLVENNEREERAAERVATIYGEVEQQAYLFLAATLVAIVVTSAFLIRSNRRLFAALASLSQQRHELAQRLIATREATLKHVARELHDEFGQNLTAIGSMLGRAARHAPDGSPLKSDLREVGEIAQGTLDKVRSLSQMLHPSILEEAGLESTIGWYLSTAERQFGMTLSYDRDGSAFSLDSATAIHVYRVLQEAVSNIARHAGVREAWVRVRSIDGFFELEVEDHGKGIDEGPARRGLGIVAMRERAELVGGSIDFSRPTEGGTLVRLRVPLDPRDGQDG